MKATKIVFFLSALLFMACGYLPPGTKSEANAGGLTPSTNVDSTILPDAEATPKSGDAPIRKNLLAMGNGAFVVERSSEAPLNWVAANLIDELPTAGWASAKGKVSNELVTIELPARTTLTSLSFDTVSVDVPGSGAKDIIVESSDTSAVAGFKQILATTLKEAKDRQEFSIGQPVAGRWLRLRAINNYGSTEYIEVMDMRGYGEQEPLPPLANVSGTYDSRFGVFHIKQDGTSIIGCYESLNGLIRGGVDGRVMTLEWKDDGGVGPVIMVFSADGTRFVGAYGRDTIANGFTGEWTGKKISDKVGNCPDGKTKIDTPDAGKNQIGTELKESGRAITYGINFDFNSDVIKPESKATLDQIAGVLQENKDWKMTVEGHTDNIGSVAFNKTLADKRAAAVKAFLVGKGIDAARLTSSGMGMSKPLTSNETELGRAQNRRVELVKNKI